MSRQLPLHSHSENEVLQGTVKDVRYTSDDGRFGVLLIRRQAVNEDVFVIGDLATLREGEDARFRGRWETHEVYGKRFRAAGFTPVLPDSKAGMVRFLSSGIIEGVGPALAERLVKRFGARTLDVIATQSSRIKEVPGIGKKRAEAIANAVRERRASAESLTFLHALGLGPGLARKLLKRYGDDTVTRVRQDPYRTTGEVVGVGFLTADRIGRALEIPNDDPRRISGATLHVLRKAEDDGHVFLPKTQLVTRICALGLEAPLVDAAIENLCAEGRLIRETDKIYSPDLHQAEVNVARILHRIANHEGESSISPFQPSREFNLTPTQLTAVNSALQNHLMVLTGGPGTGKTTTTRAIVDALEQCDLDVALCAPTGRAAKRLSEATGRSAQTIHRLLEWNPARGSFNRNASSPIEHDVMIVDEASMLNLRLAHALLQALDEGTRLILIGDVNQLPPVGSGQILRELIRSERGTLVKLTEVFRQAQESAIVRAAHALLDGAVPTPTPNFTKGSGDLFILSANDAETARQKMTNALKRIPIAYGLDPRRDVQILSPMRKGPLGAEELNLVFQDTLNPVPSSGASARFRPGDKVMQLRNDYEREVFNGDIGWVSQVTDGVTYVTFDEIQQAYKADELDALSLAYVSTVHKAQGSEFPAVMIVVHRSHHILLNRSLIYTALTRAKRLVLLVGERQALKRAANHDRRRDDFCDLSRRLQSLQA